MSDEAPVEAVEPVAEVAEGEPTEKVEAKPKVEEDPFESLLKSKPLKYKAGGKEKAVSSSKDLQRLLSRVDGTESAATEALKYKQEKAEREGQIKALASMPKAQRIQVLEQMGIPKNLIFEAFEDDVLSQAEREKEQASLSPREREAMQRAEAAEARARQFEEVEQQRKAKEEEDQWVAQANDAYGRMSEMAAVALQKANIPAVHAPRFLPAIAEQLDRAARLGIEVDPEELTGRVMEEHGAMADTFYGSLSVEALADRLQAMEAEDAAKPGAKTNRLKLLMLECAKRLRAKSGQPVPVQSDTPRPNGQKKEMTAAEKWERAQLFGR